MAMGVTPSSNNTLGRPSTCKLHWKLHWPQLYRRGKVRLTQNAHPALFYYDVLFELFAAFDLDDKEDLATCARSAQVCWAWSEPALQVLWTSRSGRSLKDLHQVLQPVDVSRISKLLVTLNPFHPRHSDKWALFLHRGSQMRALKCSYYDWRDGPIPTIRAEAVLIHSLVLRNQGRTFLPALQSAEWHEYPRNITRGALFSLVPSSLGSLNVTFHWSMTQEMVETFMTKLSSTILGLHTLRLTAVLQSVAVERLSYPPHLRHLFLDPVGISLLPAELETLFSHFKTVKTLSVHIGDDNSAWHDGPTVHLGTSLRTLHVEGEWRAIAALVFRLDAPSLRELDIRVKEKYTPFYDPKGHHLLATELGRNTQLARTLRSLSLRHSTLYPGSTAAGSVEDPVVLFPQVLEPLLRGGLTTHLETLVVAYWHRAVVVFTDDEVLQLAQACPSLKRLTLSTGVRLMRLQPPTTLPSLVALRHIAHHCPELTYLAIELAHDSDGGVPLPSESERNEFEYGPPQGAEGSPEHPLETLELVVWMPVGWKELDGDVQLRDEVRRYANRIFPHRYRDTEIFLVGRVNGGT